MGGRDTPELKTHQFAQALDHASTNHTYLLPSLAIFPPFLGVSFWLFLKLLVHPLTQLRVRMLAIF